MRRTILDAQRVLAAALLRRPEILPVTIPNITNVLGVAIRDEKLLALFYEFTNLFVDHALLRDLFGFSYEIQDVVTGRLQPAGPAQGGESVGSDSGETGTLGCLVEDASRTRFLLSCNHVLADTNNGTRRVTEAWQPGQKDGGSATDRIGFLHDFCPIVMGGTSPNEIDAAIATPDTTGSVTNKTE